MYALHMGKKIFQSVCKLRLEMILKVCVPHNTDKTNFREVTHLSTTSLEKRVEEFTFNKTAVVNAAPLFNDDLSVLHNFFKDLT